MKKTISNKTIEALADRAICRMAEEDNIELGVALKNIPADRLRDITGKPRVKKSAWRRPWLWQAASIAAVVVIAVVCILRIQQNSNDAILKIQSESNSALDNTLVAYNYVPAFSKDGEEIADISAMSESELKDYLPALMKAYEDAPADDIQECQDSGMRLAMAYLKLHEREKAVSLLNELKSRFDYDEDYVAKCNKIINLLK